MKRIKIEVEGMTCPNCERHVKEELEKIRAKRIIASFKNKSAIFSMNKFDENQIKNIIKISGYKSGKMFVKEERFLGRLFK
jgi:mercuric reductase